MTWEDVQYLKSIVSLLGSGIYMSNMSRSSLSEKGRKIMTVEELIDALSEIPGNAEVEFCVDPSEDHYPRYSLDSVIFAKNVTTLEYDCCITAKNEEYPQERIIGGKAKLAY